MGSPLKSICPRGEKGVSKSEMVDVEVQEQGDEFWHWLAVEESVVRETVISKRR